MSYYTTTPHPTAPGRWLVAHRTISGQLVADEDCPSLQAAEKAAAWLEAERTGAIRWPDHSRAAQPMPTATP
jgi:hypothetical protein